MLSDDTIKFIASIFCGDIEGYYKYKSGSMLVRFFNQQFNYNDTYGQGFPSRWKYVFDKLVYFLNSNTFDKFLNIILSQEYIMTDKQCSLVEATTIAENIFNELNKRLKANSYKITKNGKEYHFIRENDDLVFVGSGGFANVYLQKSTGLIIKKLRDDFLTNHSIRSRFKREFTITKSLTNLQNIIKVFNFDENECSYTMEQAETTLEKYIQNSTLSDETKIKCVKQILKLFKDVHNQGIIHRDISPNNIFILGGILKVADFGLGKDLNMFTSHQTCLTNSVGQLRYCAPEQFMQLKDGDKRSDVYSLGRLLNFIMTKDCNNSHHMFRIISEKATNQNSAFRYADAGAMLIQTEKTLAYHEQKDNETRIMNKIDSGLHDEEVDMYISELTNDKLCRLVIENGRNTIPILIEYMEQSENTANHIIQGIESEFRNQCNYFENYDPIAGLVYEILKVDHISYVIKELAANILKEIAYDVNRFTAQRLVDSILQHGIEPSLEEILQR